MENLENRKATRLRLGWLVFIGLAVFTAAEFYASQSVAGVLLLLIIIALIKAGLIVHYFMHLSNIRQGTEAH